DIFSPNKDGGNIFRPRRRRRKETTACYRNYYSKLSTFQVARIDILLSIFFLFTVDITIRALR
ncbi:MAG: hypothetical protein ACJ70Z_07310, partial [Nitrososphaera sp.]